MTNNNNPKKTTVDEKSIEQRRIDYLRNAIRDKYDYKKVSLDLKQNWFRDLYVRNPVECILKYCFMYNEANPAKKKGLREFNELWRNLIEYSNINYIPVGRTKEIVEGKKKGDKKEENKKEKKDAAYITLHDLRSFILSASAEYETTDGQKAKTDKKTLSLEKELSDINPGSSDSDEKFMDFYRKYCLDMSNARSTLRYYFVKYVYFFISFQILDFIKVLKRFTQTKPERYITDLYLDSPNANLWSIESGILIDERFDALYQMIDTNKTNGVKLQPPKVLIGAALNHLPLWRSDYIRKADEISPLFLSNNGAKLQISKIVDKTMIFPQNDSDTREGHLKLMEAINKLTLDDFEGFPIDFKKLYHLLFEKIISKGETWDISIKKNKNNEVINDRRRIYTSLKSDDGEFIIGIIDGKYDLSRSALLMALASIKGAIRDDYWLKNDDYSLYEESCFLTLTRVNNILSSSGYLRLPDNIKTLADSKVDNTYKRVFSGKSRSGKETVADILCNSMGEFYEKYNYSPLPFDIAEIPSDKIGNKITGRG